MKIQKSAFKIKIIENCEIQQNSLKLKMFDGLLKKVSFKICYEKYPEIE